MIDKDYIIQEVAKKHKIIISDDDPILTTLAIQDEIFNQTTSEINRCIQNFSEQAENINSQYLENSKILAEKIIGQAVEYAREQIEQEKNDLISEIRLSLEDHHNQVKKHHESKIWGFGIAALSVISCVAAFTAIILSGG